MVLKKVTPIVNSKLAQELKRYGADEAALRLFDVDGPELLPYATLLTARDQGNDDLQSIEAVYEWQDSPLIFLIERDQIKDDQERLHRIRRLLAMRGDAPYLGVVGPGRLDVYYIGLDALTPGQAQVDVGVPRGEEIATLAHLANVRPGLLGGQRQWISQVVLKLLSSSIDALKLYSEVDADDAISLVGRALFTRFLGDRRLLGALDVGEHEADELFDNLKSAETTSQWLDKTFNGDFLPISADIYRQLPKEAFKVLGNILRRAPDGQLFLGWAERWDNLDFAHIPVGVLSQAYEHYLHKHSPDRQRREGGYYTPQPIADLMVRGGLGALTRENVDLNVRVLDPAAGAGVFLLTSFRQLVAERWRRDGIRPETDVLRGILFNQIVGFDINEAALRFAALGLYLISIELDPHPEPVRKLRFENLRDRVLLKVGGELGDARSLGSLGPNVGNEHFARYDLVIGNPPWASGTKLPNWDDVHAIVKNISQARLPEGSPAPTLPNEVLDLPFVWRAMEWAKPGAQIVFALHARVLFQQGDGMQQARHALFSALDVTAVINGVELRQTRVWPEIDAPFCILYARNRIPPIGSGFRLVSPRLEGALNSAGSMRIDVSNAELVSSQELLERPEILKVLFRGTRADLQVYDKLRDRAPLTLGQYWHQLFGSQAGRARYTGNGYQNLRKSSRVRKNGDGLPGVPADYLHGLPEITSESMASIVINVDRIPLFNAMRIHDPRPRTLFDGPLLIVQKAPPAALGRIRTAVASSDVVYNTSFYGYSARHHPVGELLTRYLSLIIGSRIALWQALITSGEFGFERETIEKTTIDGLMVPALEVLSKRDIKDLNRLFDNAQAGNSDAWTKIDEWVAKVYGLRLRDVQVILDTLEFNLPFAKNRRQAQERPSETVVEKFCSVLCVELEPWAKRYSRVISVRPAMRLNASPWRTLCISSGNAKKSSIKTADPNWAELLPVADHFAATEVSFNDAQGGLYLARLDQARYWSESQARQAAKRVAWEHLDVLRGHKIT